MIKLSGKIQKIFEPESFGNQEKKFEKQQFWLQEVGTESKYTNTWSMELWNADIQMSESLQEGDFVTCYVDIKGKYYEKNGKEGVIVSLKCWNFEKDGKTFKELKGSQPSSF